jgi:CPA1 family monovalent cation:H+ antiporter
MKFASIFVVLFTIASAVGMLARRLKTPYTVALVVTGVVLGSVHIFTAPDLTKELLYAIFLPGLLFEAAFHLEARAFRRNAIAIVALAVPGVAVAIGATAGILVIATSVLPFIAGFRFVHALVFAALIAATDPIAVVAMFKSLGAPKRLGVLVEGESLLNDGTAVVFFTMALGFLSGNNLGAAAATLYFIRIVGMGALIGAAIAFAAALAIQQVDDPMIEITITTIAAYGSFAAAEQFHFSGVIATVVAGIVVGTYARGAAMGPSTRIAVETFWEYVAFALNSVVFLLIGFQVRIESLLASWKTILVAYVAVTAARALVVAGVTSLLSRTPERVPWKWSAVMTWGGLRGALSMVLALALPHDFPHRDMIITITFGVVLISLLLQGLTMAPLLQRLGIVGSRADREAYERLNVTRRTAVAALEALSEMVRRGRAHAQVAAPIRKDYEELITRTEKAIQECSVEDSELLEEEERGLRRALLVVEKDALRDEQRRGLVGEHVLEGLLRDVDARAAELGRTAESDDDA